MVNISNRALAQFLDYVHDWYGEGGVYDMGATHSQIADATMRYLREPAHLERFEGDTLDRGTVRIFLEDMFGLSEVRGSVNTLKS
jgi:hypothetical protein